MRLVDRADRRPAAGCSSNNQAPIRRFDARIQGRTAPRAIELVARGRWMAHFVGNLTNEHPREVVQLCIVAVDDTNVRDAVESSLGIHDMAIRDDEVAGGGRART